MLPSSNMKKIPWKPILGAIGAIAFFIGLRALDAPAHLTHALNWIAGLGPLGPILFILLYITSTVAFLPGSILTLGAGAVFGVVWGSIYVSIASTLGATAAFLVGRHLARDWVEGKLESFPKFKAVDSAVAEGGWRIVGLIRLSPAFPFNLLNYAFGLTQVKLRDYIVASWLGMMPGTVMYVYLGSLAGDLATLGAGGRAKTPAEWALYGVGLAATIGVTVYVTKIARKALQEKIHES
ncbi:MAG: hypothetical protein COB53_01170 [Elusimicrobia bacterium]|nr:MAG: hypothetical protein COB53_01170 [Elusimicrobiota bacterium]